MLCLFVFLLEVRRYFRYLSYNKVVGVRVLYDIELGIGILSIINVRRVRVIAAGVRFFSTYSRSEGFYWFWWDRFR